MLGNWLKTSLLMAAVVALFGVAALFGTHPANRERITRLLALAR